MKDPLRPPPDEKGLSWRQKLQQFKGDIHRLKVVALATELEANKKNNPERVADALYRLGNAVVKEENVGKKDRDVISWVEASALEQLGNTFLTRLFTKKSGAKPQEGDPRSR